MRIRVAVAAVSGALALSVLTVPGAYAAGFADHRTDIAKVREAVRAASGKTPFTGSTGSDDEPYNLDLSFSNVKVNSGRPIVVGTTNRVSVPVTYSVKHAVSVDITADDFLLEVEIYRGPYDELGNVLFSDDAPSCTASSSTAATCKGTIDVYPQDELRNEDAGTWKAIGVAIAWNGVNPEDLDPDWSKVGSVYQDGLGTAKLQRYSKLTVNASPEPVTKGKTVTVTGLLSRANWDTGTYTGYTSQPVQLQFRKKTSDTYTTLKSVKSDSMGNLKTITTATVDGYFRYSFAGTATTPTVKATGDYVDVK
ncbi:hypothetical protein [Streptomyces sp. NBC_00151]|uniref:hypothetical protein n=1 Tax=Streptomyces sp. NBC_00151 TaxID=2975669 RepID=UPI002DD7A04C|nr:hypothetical protein [Streptomyces sp. NBC_00151]WRZ44452.1 hypothetical protein OG915_44415 [Streptomyces sp. NBC_00151]